MRRQGGVEARALTRVPWGSALRSLPSPFLLLCPSSLPREWAHWTRQLSWPRQVLLPDWELVWVAPAGLVLLFQKVSAEKWLDVGVSFVIWHFGEAFNGTVYLAKKSSSWEILWVEMLRINVNQEGIVRVNLKILICLGCSNCSDHRTSWGIDNACLWMGHEFPSFLGATTTTVPPTNPRVSEAPALFSKSGLKSYQQYWTIRLEGRVVNSCSLKAWKLTKAILVSPGRRGMKRMGAGRNNSEVERVIGGVCFPDSFQRKEICVVCCGAENAVQNQLMFFFVQQLLFSGTFLFRLTKCLPSFFMVIDSKSLRVFLLPRAQGRVETRTHIRGKWHFAKFREFCHRQGKTIQCTGKAQVCISVWGGWLISFFQGADGGGQCVRKGKKPGKGEKKEWDLWPSGSQLLCHITIPNTGSSWHPEKQPWNSEQWSACKGEIKQSSSCFDWESHTVLF